MFFAVQLPREVLVLCSVWVQLWFVTRDFSLSSVLLRMEEAGGSGYEVGAVLTCHSPSLAMNFPAYWSTKPTFLSKISLAASFVQRRPHNLASHSLQTRLRRLKPMICSRLKPCFAPRRSVNTITRELSPSPHLWTSPQNTYNSGTQRSAVAKESRSAWTCGNVRRRKPKWKSLLVT